MTSKVLLLKTQSTTEVAYGPNTSYHITSLVMTVWILTSRQTHRVSSRRTNAVIDQRTFNNLDQNGVGPLYPIPSVYQANGVSLPLCTKPIVSQSHCVPAPLCTRPIGSDQFCTKPTGSQSLCVPGPLCFSPFVY